MARQIDVLLGSVFVGWDTSPGAAAMPMAWPADFPVSYQDAEKALLVGGVAIVLQASAAGSARRAVLSFQGAGPGFVEWMRVPAVNTVAVSTTRRIEFQVGNPTGLAGTVLREALPSDLRVLPGHRLVVDVEGRQAGDVVSLIVLRGSITGP